MKFDKKQKLISLHLSTRLPGLFQYYKYIYIFGLGNWMHTNVKCMYIHTYTWIMYVPTHYTISRYIENVIIENGAFKLVVAIYQKLMHFHAIFERKKTFNAIFDRKKCPRYFWQQKKLSTLFLTEKKSFYDIFDRKKKIWPRKMPRYSVEMRQFTGIAVTTI